MKAEISDSLGSVTVTFSDAELRTLNEALKRASEFCELQSTLSADWYAATILRKAAVSYRVMAVKILGAS